MPKMTKIALNLLSEKLKDNLAQIQENQLTIQKFIAKQNLDPKNHEFDKKCKMNLFLLQENLDFIYTQLTLTHTAEKEKAVPENNISLILNTVNDCFELTINGLVIYNSMAQEQEKFVEHLINYNQQLEKYNKAGSLK